MAFDDIEDQACVCAWVSILGETSKNQVKAFVSTAKTLMEQYKTFWLLIGTDWEDIYKKEGLELLLSTYQSVTDPIEASMVALINQTKPFADCPPLATVNTTMLKLKNYILEPVQELEFEVQNYIDSIQINQAKTETIDNLIGVLDDLSQALDECGT